ncbi:MAG: hypothetical protein VKO21_07760 [Candidatus Sericytochromatia bacterium]|nr:hypothetical protein [Candidatus Sericytochromatia bacterium]
MFRPTMPRFRHLTTAIACVTALAASLAGCGTTGSPTTNPNSFREQPFATPLPLPMPGFPGVGNADSQGAAQHWARTVSAAHSQVAAYTAQMTYLQIANTKTVRGVYDLRGKRPRLLRIQIVQGEGQGTKLSWSGGKTIRVRAAGLLSAIPLDLPLTDPRIISPRGYTLDQTDIPGLLSLLNHPAAQIQFMGEQGNLALLRITGPHLLSGIRDMTARIDMRTGFASSVEMSDGRQVVFRIELLNFRPVPDVSVDI